MLKERDEFLLNISENGEKLGKVKTNQLALSDIFNILNISYILQIIK